VQDVGPVVDATTGEELLRGGALELGALQRRRALGGVEVDARRLRAEARPLEQLAQAPAKATPPFRRRCRGTLERHALEAHGLIERQLGCCAFGRMLGIFCGALDLSRADEVHGERLGVGVGHPLEREGEPRVVPSNRDRRQPADDRLPDAIVYGLDDLPAITQPRSHEAVSDERGDDAVDRVDTCGLGERRDGERTPAHRDHLDDVAGRLREFGEPGAHDFVQRDRAIGRIRRPEGRGARELFEQERVPPRLARDRVGGLLGRRVARPEEREGQLPRLAYEERSHRDGP
jgi:hypothetical protein